MFDYWKECVGEALCDAGVYATDNQIEIVAQWVEGAHENYGLASGSEFIPDPMLEENKRIKAELDKERRKIICPSCGGSGNDILHGPYHSSYSTCSKCNGYGKIDP